MANTFSLPENLKYHSHGPWNVLDLCGFIHCGVNFGINFPFFQGVYGERDGSAEFMLHRLTISDFPNCRGLESG